MVKLVELLSGGDRQSIGRANEATALVLATPGRLPELAAALADDALVVRGRAADALEKVSAARPDLIQPLKRRLLGLAHRSTQQELRWHLAQMIGRLDLTAAEARRAAALLARYFEDDKSRIVRVMALQAIHDLAARHSELGPAAEALRRRALAGGESSLAARARKLARLSR